VGSLDAQIDAWTVGIFNLFGDIMLDDKGSCLAKRLHCSVCMSGQRCNRYKTGIGIVLYRLYFEPDTGISIFFVGEKIHCLVFGFTNEKKVCLCFFLFFLQYSPISCVSNKFLVGSVI
jgi:hypothetical protein